MLAEGAEPLRTPIANEPCLAYEIGIRLDDYTDGSPGTRLLVEQRSATLSIGGAELRPNAPFSRISDADLESKPGRIFLRERGFFPTDVGLHVYQRILPE